MDVTLFAWKVINLLVLIRTFAYAPLFLVVSLSPVLWLTYAYHPTSWPWYWAVILATQLMSLGIHLGVHGSHDLGEGKIEQLVRKLPDAALAEIILDHFHLTWMMFLQGVSLWLLYATTGDAVLTGTYTLMVIFYELFSLSVHQYFVPHPGAQPIAAEPVQVVYLGLITGLCTFFVFAAERSAF